MRYELSDVEWSAIKPMLPNKPRGIPRVNDCRVLNGIFWVLRCGAPWRDLPDVFRPIHHLLQSLRPLATSGRLGSNYERTGRRAGRRCPNDRYVDCSRASARRLHHSEQAAVHGPITGRFDL
jgi:transposase